MKSLKNRLGLFALAGMMTLSLAACSVPLGDAEIRTGEDGTLVVDGEAIWDEAAPDGETETPAEEPALTEDTGTLYEYYSTREELLAGIREGYVFCLDHTFEEAARPTVTGGHWPFRVSGEDTLDLSFVFRSAGGSTPAALHISARCQSLTREDLSYLEELRLR